MNQIEKIRAKVLADHPGVSAEIDEPMKPMKPSNPWHLDIVSGGGAPSIVVEWRPDRGFGVSTVTDPMGDFTHQADEIYPNVQAATDRVLELIRTGEETNPEAPMTIGSLRVAVGLTQKELAERSGIKQANVSRIEGRSEVMVSTLARMVHAMGGRLRIMAEFPDGKMREIRVEQGKEEAKEATTA